MKKLMTMIAAVATAFGLYAAGVTGNASFEATTEAGVSADEFDAASAAAQEAGWSWAGDPLKLGAYNSDAYGYQGTGNTRRSEFEGYPNQLKYLKLETTKDQVLSRTITGASIFVDQLVQFTGFEDAPVFTDDDDTKIAVWMEEAVISEEPEVTATNLWITAGAGKVQVQIGATNEYQLGKWYRLTIKSLGVIDGASTVGFIVYIDGQQVGSWMDAAKTLIDPSSLSAANKALLDEGKLFPAMNTGAIASVGYNGIGAIDDLTIDDQGPEFARKIPFTVTGNAMLEDDTIKDSEGNDVDPASGVANGTMVIVTWKAKAGYKILGDKKTTSMTIDGQGKTIEPGEDIIAAEVVAKLNDTTDLAESELAAALADLNEDDVIATVKACSVYTDDDEQATIWAFTPNTTITGTETGLAIVVGSYEDEEETVAGSLAFNGNVAAGETLAISFDEELEGDLTFGGTVAGALEVANGTMIVAVDITLADGASIKAAAFDFDTNYTTITLEEGAEVKATENNIEEIVADDGLELQVSEKGEDEYYTYTAVEPAADPVVTVRKDGGEAVPYTDVNAALADVDAYTKENPDKQVQIDFLQDYEVPGAYSFSKDTQIQISNLVQPDKQTQTFWMIPYGTVTFLQGIGNYKSVAMPLEGGHTLTFAGAIGEGSFLGAYEVIVPTEGKITLAATAKVTACVAIADAKFVVPDGYRLKKEAGEGEYTYTAELIPPTYALEVTQPENGTLTTDPAAGNIEAGTTVTVTATPASGYVLESITTNGQALAGNTFKMPAEKVTVAATFTASAAPDPTQDDPKDIPAGKTAAEYFPNVSAEIKATEIPAQDLAVWCQGKGKGEDGKAIDAGGANIKLDAYKLDCANTTEAINAAKEDFKFTAEDLAQVMADPTKLETLNEQSINGTLVITKWADPAFKVAYTDGAACFYKAEVKVPGEK